MTLNSLNELVRFLNTYQPKPGCIADYGGTHEIGAGLVKNTLASGGLTDYHALDLDSGVDLLQPIKGKKYDLGLCMDLLEHTTNPFIVAKNIVDSLNKGAYLFVTVPFIWEIHLYPGDYWRFTQQGVVELFKEMELLEISIVRDKTKGESVPRHRVVGVFRK